MNATMKAIILQATPENLSKAAERLRQGELVAMPTETVYGLAGSALNPEALARIFEAKERPVFDPLIIHVAPEAKGVAQLEALGIVDRAQLTPKAQSRVDALIAAFWPGPLTFVLPKLPGVPDLATSGLATVAVRMPAHPVAQALIRETGIPLAAPSANRFGRISPTSAQDVAQELGDRIPWILDGGRSAIGLESTVLSVDSQGELSILRPGGISPAQIEAVAQVPVRAPAQVVAQEVPTMPQTSPGLLTSHYAPRKPLFLLPGPLSSLDTTLLAPLLTRAPAHGMLGLIVMSGAGDEAAEKLATLTGRKFRALSLSKTGDLHEIAFNLFSAMRQLDGSEVTAILCESCTATHGLGHAIGDRLRRASAAKL